jgi:heat shock protein HslJ
MFVDCASGERLVVAQEADNKALESAYIAGRRAPEESMLATVIGRVESRVNMEGPARPMLIVEQFVSIRAGTCETASTASLENTYWALVRVGGNAVVLGEGQGEPYMVLHSNDKRVAGMSGCNRMMGGYTVTADRIVFTQMAGTMMACDKGMDVEQAFLKALGEAAAWRITGETLELTDASSGPLATFESRYLR